MAKDAHPGKKNSLDALCERYQVDNSARTLHGALLDAQLLAEVYLTMTRGQESLAIEVQEVHVSEIVFETALDLDLIVLAPSDEERAAHLQALAEIDKASGGSCLWKRLEL
jgi:DNA polymerase-3 subunit epsilon